MKKIVFKAGGVVYDDNFFYIVYREKQNDYSLPKGHAEEGEYLYECAIREIEEELAIKAEIVGYCGEVIYSISNDTQEQINIIVFYLMKVKENINKEIADDVTRVIKISRLDNHILNCFTYESDKKIVSQALKILSTKSILNYTPLFELAKINELPSNQYLDLETLVWIIINSGLKINSLPIIPDIIKLNESEFDMIKLYLPTLETFKNKKLYDGIHGIFHILRVMLYYIFVEKLNGQHLNAELLIAASLHDTQRDNDKEDLNHGEKSAIYFNKIKNRYNINFNNDMTYNIIKYHNLNILNIPDDIIKLYSEEIKILKYCDALDRFRLPKIKRWPDYNKIDNLKIKELNDICKFITVYSEILRFVYPNEIPINILQKTLRLLGALK